MSTKTLVYILLVFPLVFILFIIFSSPKKVSCYLTLSPNASRIELWKYINISSTRHHHQLLGNYRNITEASEEAKKIKCSLSD